MATAADLAARTRRELGDLSRPFRDTARGTGDVSEYDLSATNINQISVTRISGDVVTDLVQDVDYEIDSTEGTLFLLPAETPLADGDVLIISGTTYGMFSDAELEEFVADAITQHCNGRYVDVRYRDNDGFIRYDEMPMDIDNLPENEEYLVSLLATIEALWALTTDAASDVDIDTAEGTQINRGQRYAQMRSQIDVLTDKYKTLCEQLNVGIYRIEMSTLRRVSRLNGRLVPVFKEREYDDYSLPQRQLPPIDHRHDDESGVPSPVYGGWGY